MIIEGPTVTKKSKFSLKRSWKALRNGQYVKPLLILILIFIFQQLSGAYVIIFYAVSLFQKIGGRFEEFLNEYEALLLLGIIRFVMSIVASG